METSPRDRIGTPFSIQLPQEIRLMDEVASGAKPPCKYIVPDCTFEARSWLHQDEPGEISFCNSRNSVQRQFVPEGFYVTIFRLDTENENDPVHSSMMACGADQYHFRRRLLEGQSSHHEVKRNASGEGTCTVQFSNVQPLLWDGTKRHFYIFGRVSKERDGHSWVVSVIYETREDEWNILKDVLQRSAKIFEVDWDKLTQLLDRTSK